MRRTAYEGCGSAILTFREYGDQRFLSIRKSIAIANHLGDVIGERSIRGQFP
ncbi:hypothetical protein D3C85_1889360 [compost metagenome]